MRNGDRKIEKIRKEKNEEEGVLAGFSFLVFNILNIVFTCSYTSYARLNYIYDFYILIFLYKV